MGPNERRSIEEVARPVHPRPEQEALMPYAPAIHVSGPADILFISGSTSSPLYHRHPHVAEEHRHPVDIESQTRRAMEGIRMVLDAQAMDWRNVVKVTKYLTDMRDMDGMVAVLAEYFGDWKPASTTICVNCLSTPGARVELDMIAVKPRA
jgi:2-iminobutanoate/2-iminopropanoate deaminase